MRDDLATRRRLSLRQIEVFRAVMLAGSINGAAAMLGVSQPSLSRVVKRAEDVLGFSLFERVRNGLRPTREAETLFALVGRVYGQLDILGDAVDRMAQGDGGLLRFGTTGSPGRSLVPAAVSRLRADAEGLSFQSDVLLVDQIIDYLVLRRGEAVVSIFPVAHPLIRSDVLGTCALACLVPSGHRLAGRDVVHVGDLASEYLVLFEAETPHGSAAEELFSRAGLTPRVGVRIRHIETAIGLVAEGVGIAIVDDVAVIDRQALSCTVARIEGAPPLAVYLNWNRESVRSQFLRRLQRALAALLRRPAPWRSPMP